MYSASRDLLFYLLDRRLINHKTLVDGDFVLVSAGLRNQSRMVLCKNAQSYFIKIASEVHPDAKETIEHEAEFYKLAGRVDGFAPLRSLLPQFLHYDAQARLLVLGLIPSAENVNMFHLRNQFPPRIGEMMGKSLSICHQIDIKAMDEGNWSGKLSRRVPWIFSFPDGNTWATIGASPANAQLLRMVQSEPVFAQGLLTLRDKWKASALIHADAKWDNFVLFSEQSGGEKEIKLLDWELCDIGDPLWDVAGIIQSYFFRWTTTTVDQGNDREESLLKALQPSLQAFWSSYCDDRQFSPAARKKNLRQCLAYAAARLIQSAYEASVSLDKLTPASIATVQLSANILKDLDASATHLMGIRN